MTHCLRQGWLLIVLGLFATTSMGIAQSLVPPPRPPSPIVRELLQDEFRTDQERRALQRFHGTWDDEDLVTPMHVAEAAMMRWQLDDPIFNDPEVSNLVRAEVALRRGDTGAALRLFPFALQSVYAKSLYGRLLLDLGRTEEAEAVLIEALQHVPGSAADQVARIQAARALALLSGRTGEAYQELMNELAQIRAEVDPLYWPAILVEAELLLEKHRLNEAGQAFWDVLELNPRCSEAWYLLGRLATLAFDFESSLQAAEALRRIQSDHPLADFLEAEVWLMRRDPEAALDALTPVLDRYPDQPLALSLELAALVLQGDELRIQTAADNWESRYPGSPLAATWTGRLLSLHRQYADAEEWLNKAIRVQQNWPLAHVELGLMLWQAGEDASALEALQEAVDLDPFNRRAANSLDLILEIRDYEIIQTEHFEIRFTPGLDEALVRDMPEGLEAIHERVAGRFGWEPDQRTVIEVLPDHERFAVRVVGMPDVHTMAACTGPVIAMEVPRRSMPRRHLGTWDWQHVLGHEYTHTITLGRTNNRIPLWLTEGLAVLMEPSPRGWPTKRMVADEWSNDTLLEPDELNWAFIRPRRPQDRNLAYTQSWLMVRYLLDVFGEVGLERLLDQYRDGVSEPKAFPAALGVSRERFHEDFVDWTGTRVQEWGLNAEPSLEELARRAMAKGESSNKMFLERRRAAIREGMRRALEDVGTPRDSTGSVITPEEWHLPEASDLYAPEGEQIKALLEVHPDHPDLLELSVMDRVQRGVPMDPIALRQLQTYVTLRPGDPLGHRLLGMWWMDQDDPEKAIEHLKAIASFEVDKPDAVVDLAVALRSVGRAREALAAMRRAVSIDPYDPQLREHAAALAIEADNLQVALEQIEALLLLEPGQPRHERRLDAIRRRIEAP